MKEIEPLFVFACLLGTQIESQAAVLAGHRKTTHGFVVVAVAGGWDEENLRGRSHCFHQGIVSQTEEDPGHLRPHFGIVTQPICFEDGFEAGWRVSVAGSDSNDGFYTIGSVTDTVLTLTGAGAEAGAGAENLYLEGLFHLPPLADDLEGGLGALQCLRGSVALGSQLGHEGLEFRIVHLEQRRAFGDFCTLAD